MFTAKARLALLFDDFENITRDLIKSHSKFKIEQFMTHGFGNDWMRYQQTLREIDARKNLYVDLKENLAIALLEAGKKSFPGLTKSKRRLKAILKNKSRRKVKAIEEKIKNVEYELTVLIKIARKYKAEKFKCLTAQRINNLEAQAWFEKAKFLAAVDLLAMGQPSKQTLDFIFQLPKEYRNDIFNLLRPEKRQNLLLWASGKIVSKQIEKQAR